MKFGFRKPSVKKSIKARTTGRIKRTVKKTINPLYGKKESDLLRTLKNLFITKYITKQALD